MTGDRTHHRPVGLDLRRTAVGRRRTLATVAAGVLAAGLLATALTGCDADSLALADTPLEITSSAIAFTPGEPVTGTVRNPEGELTVTLAPARRKDRVTLVNYRRPSAGPELTACDYSAADRTFACDTTGRAEGMYVVSVTDAGMPSEGAPAIAVALNEHRDYDPAAGIVPHDDRGRAFEREAYLAGVAGKPTPVPLTGWEPGSTVRMTVRADGGVRVFSASVSIDDAGTGSAVVRPLPAGDYYEARLTDGLWTATVPFVVDRS
ncbi:MAG: hypothetical protein ACTHKG_04915 [Nocardioides sp.]